MPSPDARLGEVVASRFELERQAGKGGMGVVYRARDRQAAGRRAQAAHARRRRAIRQFRREARIAALRHPAIVRPSMTA
jgi:serine/threonine protein kinase